MIDDEDDFPINARASAKLAKLFNDNTSSDDISFIYAGSKHQPKISKPNVPLQVIIGKTVEGYQLKKTGFKSEGKLGLVLLGNHETLYYQLYMYRNNETKVASCDINTNFSLIVQDNNYLSFKDRNDISWSVHFDKVEDLVAFCREIAISKYKISKETVIQEAFYGSSQIIGSDKSVTIEYNFYSLTNELNVDKKFNSVKRTYEANNKKWSIINPIGKHLGSKHFIVIKHDFLKDFDLEKISRFDVILLEIEIKAIGEPTMNDRGDNISIGSKSYDFSHIVPTLVSSPKIPEVKLEELKERLLDEKLQYDLPLEPKTTQFSVFLSELRTSHSEMRMNINRLSDKVDSIVKKPELETCETWKPIVEKVSSLECCMNSLIEQNQSALSLLKKDTECVRDQGNKLNCNISNSTIKHLEEKVENLQNKFDSLTAKFENIQSNMDTNITSKSIMLEKENAELKKELIVKQEKYDSIIFAKEKTLNELVRLLHITAEKKEIMGTSIIEMLDKILLIEKKNHSELKNIISHSLKETLDSYYSRSDSSRDIKDENFIKDTVSEPGTLIFSPPPQPKPRLLKDSKTLNKTDLTSLSQEGLKYGEDNYEIEQDSLAWKETPDFVSEPF